MRGRAARLARQAHNLEVVGSNPTPASNSTHSVHALRQSRPFEKWTRSYGPCRQTIPRSVAHKES